MGGEGGRERKGEERERDIRGEWKKERGTYEWQHIPHSNIKRFPSSVALSRTCWIKSKGSEMLTSH